MISNAGTILKVSNIFLVTHYTRSLACLARKFSSNPNPRRDPNPNTRRRQSFYPQLFALTSMLIRRRFPHFAHFPYLKWKRDQSPGYLTTKYNFMFQHL